MIRALCFQGSNCVDPTPSVEQFPELIQDPETLLWVDFCGEKPSDMEAILKNNFKFHPLAVDDALDATHVPKLDDWGDYLYMVLSSIGYEKGGNNVEIVELDVFLGKNYLVTLHDLPINSLDKIWDTTQRDERHHKLGAD